MHSKKWKSCLAVAVALGAFTTGNVAVQDSLASEAAATTPESEEVPKAEPEDTPSETETPEPEKAAEETQTESSSENTPSTEGASEEKTDNNEQQSTGQEGSETEEQQPSEEAKTEESTDAEAEAESKPSETEEAKPEEPEAESAPAKEEAQKPAEQKTETQANKEESKKDSSSEKESSSSSSDSSSSSGQAAAGTIVPSPLLVQDFRFWTIAMDPAFAISDINILEDMNDEARAIGTLPKEGICYIIQEEEDGWVYIESGNVRGFVRSQDLTDSEKSAVKFRTMEMIASAMSKMTSEDLGVEDVADLAKETVPANENAAFTHTRSTVYQTIVNKDFALATKDLAIKETASDDARDIGTLEQDGLMYIIADKDQEWVFVESGNVRGFVKAADILMDKEQPEENQAEASDPEAIDDPEEMPAEETASEATDEEQPAEGETASEDTAREESEPTVAETVNEKGEKMFATAKELVMPKDNLSVYYSKASVKSGAPLNVQREAIIEYASQFIGNPYVWGGTDPVNGADCSGFVQTVFKQFGYYLPRTSQEQSQYTYGEKIAVEDAQPGDLIFYAHKGGSVHHVVIYAGDGKTVEAMGRKYGIVSANVNYDQAVWAVRVIEDNNLERFDIPSGLGSIHTYMGWQKVTARGSQQYAFREAAGMTFDEEGFGVVDGRYVIACTTTFGNIGDYVDFYQEDGTVIPCVIGDFKNQGDPGCTVWGHDGGKCIIEFVVDQNTWYGSGHANPGTSSCHPEWHQNIVKAERVGSFYK